MPKRVLLRGGHVLSMDPEIGDVYGGDVLLEDDRIAAVGPALDPGDAEIVDASSCIVMPGFIDSHRHTWETVIRGIAPDVSLAGYFDVVLDQLAPAYRPGDVYAGNYLGSLEAIDAGVTTVLDWSHINNTPEHADEAIRGLRDARLRSVYCYGNPNTSLADWWYTSTLKAPEDIRRVREQYFSSDDGLLTLAMGTRGPGFCTEEVVRHDWELARDVGAPISVHVGMGPFAGRFSMVKQLDDLGLLGPDTTYIHCNYLSDEEIQLIADTGGKVSIAPTVEMIMGHGTPPARRRSLTDCGPASASTSSRPCRGTCSRRCVSSSRTTVCSLTRRRSPPATRPSRRSSRVARCSSSRRSRARASAGSRSGPARSRRASRRT
jgi:5-methylthioadenosine/S-adenosylhomocysteine deaminase